MAVLMRSGATEVFRGKYRETGFDLNMRYALSGKIGGVAVLFKGGLGDPNSKSMEKLAEATYDLGGGAVSVGTVATTRSKSLGRVLFGSPRAPKHRSQSLKGSSDIVNNELHPSLLMLVGQSQGGVNVVRALSYQVDHPKKSGDSPRLAGVTIDSPGVYGQFELEGSSSLALAKFALHCAASIQSMPVKDRFNVTGKILQSTSLFELPYFISESKALQNIDISDEVAYLRDRGVDMTHIWHQEDMVSGADMACGSSLVLPGGHLTFMQEPEPIAEHIIGRIDKLLA